MPARPGPESATVKPKYAVANPDERCTCCNRELYGHAIRLLELDLTTNLYSDDERIPPENSQGWFPFGRRCAKKVLARGGRP